LGALDLPTVARLLLRGFVILAGYGLMLVGLGLAVEERDLARKLWRRVFG
jgi:hypothetical protein